MISRVATAALTAAMLIATGCTTGTEASDSSLSADAQGSDTATDAGSDSRSGTAADVDGTSTGPGGTDDGTSNSTGGASDTTVGTTPAGDAELAGEPFDGFAKAGDELGVIGVAHNDSLNIRAAPGTDQPVVTTAAATATSLVATGRARILPSSIWYEVEANGVTGWTSVPFVGFIGLTDDATAELVAGGSLPEAATMAELGQIAATGFASTQPKSLVVQSVPATSGDLGEVTYDVVGLGDDAIAGFRLHVFGTPADSGDGFTLKSIERTYLCTRGVSSGACL